MASALRHCAGVPSRRAVGWSALLPGYPQWTWREGDRGAVFFGMFSASMAVALFAWGSREGLVMLAIAFAIHVTSAADAIRQGAFPGFGRWVPTVSASLGLGLGCYGPALALASLLAWPDCPAGTGRESYAINRCAYRDDDPRPGDWIWYRSPSDEGCRLGRLVGCEGREVEWSGRRLRVDGKLLDWSPKAPGGDPIEMALTVPADQILVEPVSNSNHRSTSCGLVLAPREAVIGRAWAQLSPIWGRRLLH